MLRFVSSKVLPATLWAAFLISPAAADMRLTSPEVKEGQTLGNAQVLKGMGCTGENISPALAWSDVPEGTKSFIVTMYDPDAPTGSGFWHWSVFNIPGEMRNLRAGQVPVEAVTARNDFSQNSFAGACPPEGQTHHYIISLYAMPDARLPIDETASSAMVGFFATNGALGSARITASLGR